MNNCNPIPLAATARETPAAARVQSKRDGAGTPPSWTSEELFAGRIEIEITHGPYTYRLRQTSLGKLILTK